ncbi:MAG: ABC transporter permease [Anaerolineae bacterium]
MGAWHIAVKDLTIFVRERGWLIQLFVLPLMFIMIFSGVLGGTGSSARDERIPLAVVDLDGGPMAQSLIEGLDAAGGVRVEVKEQAEAQDLLEQREVARVLTIPAGLSAVAPGDSPVTVRLTNHPDADMEQTEAVRLVVEGAAQDLLLQQQIVASLEQMADMQAMLPAEQQAFTGDRIVRQAREQFESSSLRPLVTVEQRVPAAEEQEETPSFDMAQLAIPGFTVLFVFLAAQATARSIYEEKRVGSFRRLLAAPISRVQLLAGKALPNIAVVIVQTIVILGFGVLGLRLLGREPLTLGSDPLALVLLVLAMALCSTGLGILIAALARTENQIGGLSSLLLWVSGVLGGSMIPLFLLEQFLGPIPRVVPQFWANRGFENLLIRGLGMEAVAPQIMVLLVFALAFVAIGLWRFDYE